MGDGWFAFGVYEEMGEDMVGPIEFASDGPVDDKGPTEFGGTAGLVQVEGGLGAHLADLTGSEKRGLVVRGEPAVKVDPVTGFLVPNESGNALDPVTGLEVDPAWNEDGKTTRPVDPLRTGDPKSGTL